MSDSTQKKTYFARNIFLETKYECVVTKELKQNSDTLFYLWNLKAHYRVQNSPSSDPVTSQLNLVYNFNVTYIGLF